MVTPNMVSIRRLQVDAAPPHHAVPLRVGARLHQRGEFGLVVR